jgi:hypothetical protein
MRKLGWKFFCVALVRDAANAGMQKNSPMRDAAAARVLAKGENVPMKDSIFNTASTLSEKIKLKLIVILASQVST